MRGMEMLGNEPKGVFCWEGNLCTREVGIALLWEYREDLQGALVAQTQHYYRDLSPGSMVVVVPRAPSKARSAPSSVNPREIQLAPSYCGGSRG